GTNVTGIIASRGAVAPVGVAPGSRVIALKVLDRSLSFFASAQVIAALDWLITVRPDVQVVNMSLGTFAMFAGACDTATSYAMAFAEATVTDPKNGLTFPRINLFQAYETLAPTSPPPEDP